MSRAFILKRFSFKPTDIGGCSLWLDGADATTFTYSSGTSIATWRDKATGIVGSNTSPTNQPTLVSSSQNGNSTVFFDAAAALKYIDIPPWSFGTTSRSMFIVMKNTASAVNSGSVVGGAPHWLWDRVNGNNANVWTMVGVLQIRPGDFTYFMPRNEYLIIGIIYSTPTMTAYQTGSQVLNYTSIASYFDATNGYRLGALNNGDDSAPFPYRFYGNIAEVVTYNTSLTTPQRQQVEGYLAQKWGLTGSLPRFHPGLKRKIYPSLAQNRILNLPISSVFLPTTIASCQLWLDAADPTLFSYSSGTTIQQWNDKSGNSRHALSNSYVGWQAPTYVAGNPGYVSLQPNQALYVPGFPYNTAWSVFSCMNNVSLGARWYISPYSDLNIVLMGMSQPGNKVFQGKLAGDGDITGSHIEYTTAQNTSGTGIYSYFRDGTQIGTNTTANGISSATVRMGIGANGASGFDIGGTYYPYEILIYNQYLGTTDRQIVEGYLAWKWGLQGSLPAGHPYKSVAPGSRSTARMRPIINLPRPTLGGSFQFTTSPSQYLSIPNNTGFTQNTAFTYELWYYPTNTNTGYLVSMLQQNWITVQWSRHGAGTIGVDMSYVGNPPGYVTQNRTYAINRWHHIALTWNGTNGVLYINGVSEVVFTGAGAIVNAGNPLYIGQYQGQGQPTPLGYLTNIRYVKGVSVYTGAFTPPTRPLTVTQSAGTNISAITAGQTQLLISATTSDSLLTDSSTNNFTITNNGSVAWTALTPFT